LIKHFYILIILLNSALFAQKVNKIEFSGNKYFSNSALVDMIATKPGALFSAVQLELDINNILNTYIKSGYFETKIISVKKEYSFDSTEIDINIQVDEGNLALIGEIIIEGNKLLTNKQINGLMSTKSGELFNQSELNDDISELLNLYEKKGYPFASVIVENIESYKSGNSEKLRIKIKINENEKIKITRIVIDGNTSTNEEVITREINLGSDKSISKENLLEIQNRLENLGYFETVEQPKILKYKNETILYVKVKEGNTNTFDGILGYIPPAANESSGYITGIAIISLKNLFGTGRKLDARYDKEERTTQELSLKYLEPWVLGYPVNINLGFFQRIQDTIYIKRTLNIKSDVAIFSKFLASALFFGEQVIPTASPSAAIVFRSRLLSAGIELNYDSRDYIYNPFKGILLRTSYSVGQKKIYNSGDYPSLNLPADFTVQKASFEFELYSSFFRRQSALLAVHGFEIRSPQYETSDFFRFGGTKSVRGYREGQFLGSRVVWNNNELRYSLTRRSYAVALFDMGYYWRPADDLLMQPKQEGFIFGYGLGIRIETALGIFGVSYALGRGDSILEGKVHFGIVNDF